MRRNFLADYPDELPQHVAGARDQAGTATDALGAGEGAEDALSAALEDLRVNAEDGSIAHVELHHGELHGPVAVVHEGLAAEEQHEASSQGSLVLEVLRQVLDRLAGRPAKVEHSLGFHRRQ